MLPDLHQLWDEYEQSVYIYATYLFETVVKPWLDEEGLSLSAGMGDYSINYPNGDLYTYRFPDDVSEALTITPEGFTQVLGSLMPEYDPRHPQQYDGMYVIDIHGKTYDREGRFWVYVNDEPLVECGDANSGSHSGIRDAAFRALARCGYYDDETREGGRLSVGYQEFLDDLRFPTRGSGNRVNLYVNEVRRKSLINKITG